MRKPNYCLSSPPNTSLEIPTRSAGLRLRNTGTKLLRRADPELNRGPEPLSKASTAKILSNEVLIVFIPKPQLKSQQRVVNR